jgi:DNA-binding beta-propeller fold protein YncE
MKLTRIFWEDFMKNIFAGVSLAALLVAAVPALAQEKGGLDLTGPYDVVVGWFKPGIEGWDQRVVSVNAEDPNRVFIGAVDRNDTREGHPLLAANGALLKGKTAVVRDNNNFTKGDVNNILVLNADGKVIENWSQWNDEVSIAHHIIIDPYDPAHAVWVVDRFNHRILKFSNDGKQLLLKVGEKGVPGNDEGHFHDPASLTFLPDGSFYVADGYTNSRVVKFDKNGKYLLSWGSKGTGPSQFSLVHSVAADANRIYVADRNNDRIQIFDHNGKFLDQWPGTARVTRVITTEDKKVWVAATRYGRFAGYDLNGKLLYQWGTLGDDPGVTDNAHQFDVDNAGNVYVADANNNRVQKFVPEKGADKAHLIGRELVVKK